MAKKKSHKKTTHKRRRRSGIHGIGGAVTSSIMPILGVAVGAVASKFVSKALKPKDGSAENKLMTQGVPVALGIGLTAFMGKNAFVKSIGTGMVVAPAVSFASEKLGIGDLMSDFAEPIETRIMENIMIGEGVNIAENINIAEDITIGDAYGDDGYEN
jgi:hypothetical protein